MLFTPQGYRLALLGALQMTRDAALTINARTPILARAALAPQQPLDPEIFVMGNEKVLAMLEGALGVQIEMARLAASALAGESLPKLLRRAQAIGLPGAWHSP